MASSQVEIVTSSPFGRESCFNKFADLWVHRPKWQTTANNECDNGNNDNSIHHKDKCEMVLSVAKGCGGFSSRKPSVEVSNSGGVSSLVQKWKGFEAKRNNSMFQDNNNAGLDPPTPNEDDSFGDWESDRTAFSGPPSSHSDVTEIERLRVADIIKKLTDNDVGCHSPPRDQSEQRCFSPVVNSPRIRGRQAFNDLLMQMERDRHKEIEGLVARKAVSKFSHRGRIQALLRFRFLRRGMESKEGCHSNGKSSQTQKVIQPPVMHIRDRVILSAQKGSVAHKELIDAHEPNQQGNENRYNKVNDLKRSPTDHIQDSEGFVTSKKHNDAQENVRLLHSYENLDHEANPFSTFIRQQTKSSGINSGEKTESFNSIETSVHNKEEEEDTNHHHVTKSNYDPTVDCDVDNSTYWVCDVSNPDVGWKELQSDNQQQQGSNREWIDEVSRPRSDWEGLRQARYQEMLDPFLDNNEEIRMLLGRRSVSTFLSGGLREQIDRVIISRAKGQQTLKNGQTQEEKHERFPEQEDEVEDYSDNFDEYEEAESSVGQQSPPEYNQHHESSDYSYQVASPSTQQSSSNYYSQDSRPNSSNTSDMELIYDLRGHMEQLHQEMSELRKSIKCCMDMQIKLQRSIKKEVASAQHHSGYFSYSYAEAKNGRRNAVKKATTGGRCCVCCKMQVDSLLYRCGHMCTCFKCAHKLHWSSGKCPICRAPILDVVRTYSDHS